MHYDPFFNPSLALEMFLRSVPEFQATDVVDLARTDSTMDYVHCTLEEAQRLKPDAIVVFAGNNWRTGHHLNAPEDPYHQFELGRSGEGLGAVRTYTDERLKSVVADYVARVRSLQDRTGIAVMHVLPEFNLTDWEPPSLYDSPPLSTDRQLRWNALLRDALEAREKGQHAVVRQLAEKMLELDQGESAAAPFLLGRSLSAEGRFDEARAWLEHCADRTAVPRCQRVVQNVLREAAAREELVLVDLPHVFAQASHGALPGRRLFLDYCHMTSEGIAIAMHATAHQIVRLMGGNPFGMLAPDARELLPDPKVEACAHVCGSLYNSRFLQGDNIVRHHVDEALRQDDSILDVLLSYLEFGLSSVPNGLSSAYHRSRGQMLLRIQERLIVPKANLSFVRVVRDAVTTVRPEAGQVIDELLVREHNVLAHGTIDILSPWLWNRRGQADSHGAAYLTCYEPSLTVAFIASAQAQLVLELALKTGSRPRQAASVAVLFNDFCLAELSSEPVWRKAVLRVPADLMRRGVNELRIDWPEDGLATVSWRKRAVWGYVHSITATTLQRPC
jgi:hypothetical protein